MKLAVVGAGYVGLVTGVCLAEMGNNVTVTDRDANIIDMLNAGYSPIYEPGLDEIKLRNQANKRLMFVNTSAEAVRAAEVVFLAVGTPSKQDGAVHLDDLESAAVAVAEAMDGYRLLVIKSTVPPGTNRHLAELLAKHTQHPFDLVNNPEFLKEGTAVNDFLHPDRVVIGARSDQARQLMRRVYHPFFRTGYRLMETDPESAEMIKYASNVMLASRISLMNEISLLCQAVGADVERVRVGVGLDKRIGSSFLFPGLGYGGSCFPKDVKAMLHMARQAGLETGLCHAIDAANDRQRLFFHPHVEKEFGSDLSGKTFALLGLSYKPRTDDVRESPALFLARLFIERGATVKGVDPAAKRKAKAALPELVIADSIEDVVTDADAAFLCTEWNEFRSVDWHSLRSLMRSPIVFDGRNIYDPEYMGECGIRYYSIGRPHVRPEGNF